MDQVVDRFEFARGKNVSTALREVTVEIVDLPGDQVGRAVDRGTVQIDRDAAGHGWFVDPTPADDAGSIWRPAIPI